MERGEPLPAPSPGGPSRSRAGAPRAGQPRTGPGGAERSGRTEALPRRSRDALAPPKPRRGGARRCRGRDGPRLLSSLSRVQNWRCFSGERMEIKKTATGFSASPLTPTKPSCTPSSQHQTSENPLFLGWFFFGGGGFGGVFLGSFLANAPCVLYMTTDPAQVHVRSLLGRSMLRALRGTG